MNITRENYEAFFLDYHEGNLSQVQVEELMDFLSNNPDLKTEFDSFEHFTLPRPAQQQFASKELLKKPEASIHNDNFEEYCIASIEGELTSHEQKLFTNFVAANPQRLKILKTYEQTLLQPDNHIVFTGKSGLKKWAPNQETIASGKLPSLDQTLIAYHEGDLSDTEKKAVLALISSDSEAAGDFLLFKKSRATADKHIIFAEKELLKKSVVTPIFKQLWYYAAAAGVLAFMLSLLFLLPSPEDSIPIAGNNSGLLILEPEPQPLPAIKPEPVTGEQKPIPPKSEKPESKPEKTEAPAIIRLSPESSQLAMIKPLQSTPITSDTKPTQINQRTEFAYWALRENHFDEEEKEEISSPAKSNYVSFASIAATGIERSTGINIQRVEEQISNTSFSLWDLTGAGLAGISQLTGTSLTIEQERDENGRITLLAIGDRFRIQR